MIDGRGQFGGASRTYYTLTSTDLTVPLNQWTPVATNTLATSGSFSITATNIVNAGLSQSHFILEAR